MVKNAWQALYKGTFEQIILFDLLIQESLGELRTPWLDLFFQQITVLGSSLFIITAGELIALYFVKRKKYFEAIYINIVLVITWIMVNGLKILFARNRPPEDALAAAYGYSLPSGHAMLSLSFYGFLAYLLMKKWPDTKGKAGAALLAGLILLVGISRLYLNVHYVSDILAGYFFGAILLMLFIKGLDRARKNTK